MCAYERGRREGVNVSERHFGMRKQAREREIDR